MVRHVAVLGAGIVGVSTALWLRRSGLAVTLIDKEGVAPGASYGNAGILAAGALTPINSPGLMGKAPKMLLSPREPLFVKWSYLPKLAPFLWKFLSYATPDQVEHYAAAMAGLMLDSVDQHRALAAGTEAEQYIIDDDWCFGYETENQFKKDAKEWDIKARHGVVFQTLENEAFKEFDDFYGNRFVKVVRCKGHGRVTDPAAYTKALADAFVELGGEIMIANVEDIETGPEPVITTDKGELHPDKFVLAMGAWSGPLSKTLGLKVPLDTERGYHLELINPSRMPKCTMMIVSGKFAVSPMIGRIRMAGTVEFGGVKKNPSKRPIKLLRQHAKTLMSDITYDSTQEWMGHRPTVANSLPVIGAVGDAQTAFVGYGHQHLGLTCAAKTGRILADQIQGKTPNIDLSAFDPHQFD